MAHIKVMKWWDGGVTVYTCVNTLYTTHLRNVVCLLHLSISSAQFSSVAQSPPTLQRHGLQNSRLPCPSPTSRVYLNSSPLSQWCHPSISSSVIPFSFHRQSFPALGSFQMSQFFASGGQSIGVSYSASVLPKNIQDRFSLGSTGWTSLQSKGLKSLLQHHSSKTLILRHLSHFYGPTLPSVHDYRKKYSLD